MEMEKPVFLGVFSVFRHTLQVPLKNPNFIIFTFLTSLPMLCSMLLCETILNQIFIDTITYLKDLPSYIFSFSYGPPVEVISTIIQDNSSKLLQLIILYLGPFHLLNLLNTIAIVDSASSIYAGEKQMSLKEMLHQFVTKITRFKEPFMTSIYVHILNFLVLVWLISIITIYLLTSFDLPYTIVYGVILIASLVRWLDLTAIWSMGIVISVSEGKYGLRASLFSALFSRGSRRCGFFLMLVFFVLWALMRSLCFYLEEKWKENWLGGVIVPLAYVGAICLGNMVMWLVCFVYFSDCKISASMKKLDMEKDVTDRYAQRHLVNLSLAITLYCLLCICLSHRFRTIFCILLLFH